MLKTTVRRLVVTPGEPAGIGPDITIQLAQREWPVEWVVIADPELMQARAAQLQLPLRLQTADFSLSPQVTPPGTLKIFPVKQNVATLPQQLNPNNADYVLRTLSLAATLCLQKKASAVVTGPVHKGIINAAGLPFTGHTEFFADICGVPLTVMLFVVDQLRVALVTTHLPLANVSAAITASRLENTLVLLQQALQQYFHIQTPRILVCGLNPHAGEGGYLGREEIDIITPVLQRLQTQHYLLTGPLPADTLFTPKYLNEADAVLAMYHDQALPLVKYLGFGRAVNVTLGLPFIRTSVDHGTALDLAGSGKADAESLASALQLAIGLTQPS